MSRAVDSLPKVKPREKEVIVLSYPRNGTLGLYRALGILGYNPYHLVTCFEAGAQHCRVVKEGLMAKLDGVGESYGRAEFDKWFADNGAVLDISAFFAEELVAAYPDAKFILTHRDPDAWMRSVNNTFVPLIKRKGEFPMWHMSCVDPFTREYYNMTAYFSRFLWGSADGGEGAGGEDEVAVRRYMEHNDLVRTLVPPEKLLEVKLEDGLGWDQICPFLGVDVPDEPYPRANDPREFKSMVQGIMGRHWGRTLAGYAAVLVPVVGAGVWYVQRR